jgi:hypothetical protein
MVGSDSRPEARPGAAKTPRWRTERRHVPALARALKKWLRRSARHPLFMMERGEEGKRNTGDPGAPQITRAMMHIWAV